MWNAVEFKRIEAPLRVSAQPSLSPSWGQADRGGASIVKSMTGFMGFVSNRPARIGKRRFEFKTLTKTISDRCLPFGHRFFGFSETLVT